MTPSLRVPPQCSTRFFVRLSVFGVAFPRAYPELVIRNEAGQAEGVRYEELTPMLLNEVQRQRVRLEQQEKQLQAVQEQLTELMQRSQLLR